MALVTALVTVVLLVARQEPVPVPAAPGPTAAEIVRELAVRHGCAPGDVVEDEPPAPSGASTLTVHVRPAFAVDRFALELQAVAHNGGGRLDPRPVTEGGGYALMRLDGVLAGTEVRIIVLGEAPRATRPPHIPLQARRTPAHQPSPARSREHRLALVLDDAGNSLEAVQALADLPRAVAVAVLPNAAHARESVRELERQGREVLLHLPMEPRPGNGPGPGEGAIEIDLSAREIAERVAAALAVVDGVRGVNNHMGSRATADAPTMRAVMAALRGRGLYFLDSRTTGGSLAEGAARAAGIPALGRDVFLDVVDEADAVRRALHEAFARAAAAGEAVAIGHVHPVTVAVLAAELADLPDGLRLVRPSALAR